MLLSKRSLNLIYYICFLVFAFLKYGLLIFYVEIMKLIELVVFHIHTLQESYNANIELNCLFLEPF